MTVKKKVRPPRVRLALTAGYLSISSALLLAFPFLVAVITAGILAFEYVVMAVIILLAVSSKECVRALKTSWSFVSLFHYSVATVLGLLL